MALLIGLVSALVIFIGVAALLLSRGRRHGGGHQSATPIVFMPVGGRAPVEVRPPVLPAAATVESTGTTEHGVARPQLIHDSPDSEEDELPAAQANEHPEPVAAVAGTAHPPAQLVDSPTLMIPRRRLARSRPSVESEAMGTLRMLPGRLVPDDRSLVRDDIRFVAQDGSGEHQYTLGRAEGNPREHVQLSSPTVSRQHALLIFAAGGWSIRNLSDTNPVHLNGEDITGDTAAPLSDGDLVEIGELVFRFRS